MTVLESYPRILTSGFEASLRFYQEGLGLAPAKVIDGYYASFDLAERTALAILKQEATSAGERLMAVFRVDDVDAAVGQAVAHGGAVAQVASDKDYGLRSALLHDPDGNLVELQSY